MAEENTEVTIDETAPIGPDGNPVVVEEAPETEAEAEVEEGATAEGEPEKKEAPEGYVPIAVIQELREDVKAARTRAEQAEALIRAEQERQERIRQKFSADESAKSAQAAEQQLVAQIEQELGERPDPIEDPRGARDWDREKRAMLREHRRDQEIAELRKENQNRDQTKGQEDVQSRIANMANEFKEAHPDYIDALNHVLAAKREEAVEMGAQTEEEISAYVEDQAMKLTNTALRKGQNPAERLYTLAQKTYGWTSKAEPEKKAEVKPETKPAAKVAQKAEGQKLKTMPSGAAQSEAMPDLAEIDKMGWQEQMKWRANPKNKAYLDELLRKA